MTFGFLALLRVSVNQSVNALFQSVSVHEIGRYLQQLVKHGEDLIMHTEAEMRGQAVKLVIEDLLDLRVTLVVLAADQVGQHDVHELQHVLSGRVRLQVDCRTVEEGLDYF